MIKILNKWMKKLIKLLIINQVVVIIRHNIMRILLLLENKLNVIKNNLKNFHNLRNLKKIQIKQLMT